MKMSFTITVNDWRDVEPTDEQKLNLLDDVRSELRHAMNAVSETYDIAIGIDEK